MKIGIGTDFHLGLRQYGLIEREEDFYDQYNKMIEVFINQKVDLVIMGGDIFDQARPSPRAMDIFTKGLQKLIDNNIKVSNIIGNHTMIQSQGFVTADEYIFHTTGNMDNGVSLLDWDGVVLKEFKNSEDDVHVYGLPYHFDFNLDNFIKKVNDLNEIAKDDKVSILVLHQAFKEFCGFTGEDLSINDIDTSNFDLIICGHIHERKLSKLDNGCIFLQPGSLERSSVEEARSEENYGKGVYIIDTDKMDILDIANGFYRIPCSRLFLIADMYIDKAADVESMKKEILEEASLSNDPPVLFLTVHDTSDSFIQINDLIKDFKSSFLTARLNYLNEGVDKPSVVLDNQSDTSVKGVLKLAFNPLDDKQSKLGMDIYDNLKDGKDISGLLEDFYQQNYENNKSEGLPENQLVDFDKWLKQ